MPEAVFNRHAGGSQAPGPGGAGAMHPHLPDGHSLAALRNPANGP
jgi:hypothetical protein